MTTIAVYNFGPGRWGNLAQVARERDAILRTYDLASFCEAKYPMPDRPAVNRAPRGTGQSRRNLATYATNDFDVVGEWTKVLDEKWGKRPGRPGLHPSRALTARILREDGEPTFGHVTSHGPPLVGGKRRKSSGPARDEWVAAMVKQIDNLGDRMPVVAGADWNGLFDDVAKRLRERDHRVQVVGDKRTDRVLLVGDMKLKDWDYVGKVGGVRLGSDHKDALVVEFEVGGTRDHGRIVGTGKEGR